MFVLDDIEKLEKVLEAWHSVGITGATILESTGYHRVMQKKIPMRYSIGFPDYQEEGHYTLMSLVPDMMAVRSCLLATESVTGNLSLPNTGMFAAWKVDLVKGAEEKVKNGD
jgi:hypothetical protein